MTTQSYWIFDWLDAHGIRSRASLRAALKSPAIVQSAVELAHLSAKAVRQGVEGAAVLGGSGMDMSRLVCGTTDCRVALLENVVSKMWFYFDSVVLPDDVGDLLRSDPLHDDDLQHELERSAAVCLAIRDIGAEALIAFRSKVIPRDIPPQLQRALPRIAAELKRNAEIRRLERNYETDDILYGFRTPLSPVVGKLVLHVEFPEMTSDEDVARALASTLAEQHAQFLASDLRAARTYGVPLGTTVELHRRILRRLGRKPATADVALELRLPVMDGMPVRELLRIRQAEYDHFLLFRKRLQDLIASELNNAPPEADARKLAQNVVRDGVEPELARLRIRMRAATSSLKRTASFGVTIGAIIASFGTWFGIPPLSTVGATTAATTGASTQQKFSERLSEMRVDPMYFLWRVYEHEHRSG